MTNIRLSSDDRGKDNILYDKSGKEFNIVTYGKNFLGCGEYGRVFKLNDKYCVKIMNHVFDKVPKGYNNLYFRPRLLDTKMDPYALEYMEEHDFKNVCNVRKVLYDEDKYLGGYLMDYYQNDESINPLFANTEYLLSSMINWIYFFTSISRDGIMSDDVRSGNTMRTKDGILILDLDLFKKYNGSDIDKLNGINFVRLCDEVIAESLMGTGEEFASYKFINYNNLTIEDITKKLSELEKYKHPIEMIRQMKRR